MDKEAMKTVDIYAAGLVHCSVCAPNEMPVGEIEEAVNAANPTGITSRWKVDPDPNFADGQPNPHPCEQDTSRAHYLLNC